MHSLFRKRGVTLFGLLALVLTAITPSLVEAKPEPGARPRGFRMFARPLGALTINRVYCGLSSTGEVCVDSLNSSTIGGGFWPKGTANQYVFNSGLQAAGIIGPDGGPWAGDTTGAFFFDPKGTTQHGEQVQPIFNTQSAADNAFICGIGSFGCDVNTTDPVALAARVPNGDDTKLLFNSLLQGRTAASQGDVWWLSWDGNPGLLAGRPHPLGIVVEQRGMGWNFPSGNEDIVYFIYTFYNVSSINPADYALVRPGMREILIQQANTFQQRNEATFGIDLPDGGYTLTNLFANFSADMDVADAGVNFASVNVPFAMGSTWDHTFSRFEGWDFDPAIFSAPFFSGTGFIGVKYLKSPEISPGVEAGLTLFGTTTNGGDFPDPQNTTQLFRYVSGAVSTAAGDAPCSFNPIQDKICFIRNTTPFDMRFFQSSGPLNLGPGEFGSVVVAYIFAAPVAIGGTAACPACDIKPGNPTIIAGLDDPAVVAGGVNQVDSIQGFLDATDANTDGVLTQSEFTVVPGSLLGKALVAQAVFDGGFLLPFAPDAPEFFLIPGDEQVTVMWRPSPSETSGDPFFAIASQPLVPCDPNDPLAGLCPNALYDPNYRQFDVEGYRVYRGRVDAPNSLRLLAQFDYAGTTISDFAGQVNPNAQCAPEIGVTINCPVVFDPVLPGVGRSAHVDVPLTGPIVQVKLGDRTLLASGDAIILNSDTVTTGNQGNNSCAPSNCIELSDTGVPFVFVDNTVRNNFRYFYSVTAFDINSFQSGPANLESARITKPVTPVRAASNFENEGITATHIVGRGVPMDSVISAVPTINGSGQFSGPFPPADAVSLQFVGQFVKTIVSQPGTAALRLDGITLGDARNAIPHTYQYTALSPLDTFSFSVTGDAGFGNTTVTVEGAPFPAAEVDPTLASRFGISGITALPVAGVVQFSNYQRTTSAARGCADGTVSESPGPAGSNFCGYNGPRWFAGANETKVDPNFDATAAGNPPLTVGNAGELPGVALIWSPQSHASTDAGWRAAEASLVAAVRAADYNVYWGNPGKIDSIIDMTHNVPVDLVADSLAGSFGILNVSNTNDIGSDGRANVLTISDFACVEPWRTKAAGTGIRAIWGAPTCAASYVMTDSAELNSIAIATGAITAAEAATPRPNPGFILYLAGRMYAFELSGATLPSATVWTLRDYTGSVTGGNGAAGNIGAYTYRPLVPRQFAAVGAQVQVSFDVINRVNAPEDRDLRNVHTVPDPYYVTSEFEQVTDTKIIKFVNLPEDAIIRIYSSSGVLVRLLEHHTTTFGGALDWDVRNRNNQVVASGVYFFHIEAGNARRVGRFTIVNFAQ
jgi:hypothetical protein